MSTDKNKSDTGNGQNNVKKVDNKDIYGVMRDLAISKAEYPPYLINEFQGVMVKNFPFIQEITELDRIPILEHNSTSKDYPLLAAYKTEVENQLQLQQERCTFFLEEIKLLIEAWLKVRCSNMGEFEFNNHCWIELQAFALNINLLVHNVSVGICDYETIRQKKGYDEKLTEVTISNLKGETTTFELLDLWNRLNELLTVIRRITDKAVPLYHKYLQTHSLLFPFDVEGFLKQKKQEKEFSPIEKVQMIEEARREPGVESYDAAIDLIQNETGNRLYQDYKSFKVVKNRLKGYL